MADGAGGSGCGEGGAEGQEGSQWGHDDEYDLPCLYIRFVGYLH